MSQQSRIAQCDDLMSWLSGIPTLQSWVPSPALFMHYWVCSSQNPCEVNISIPTSHRWRVPNPESLYVSPRHTARKYWRQSLKPAMRHQNPGSSPPMEWTDSECLRGWGRTAWLRAGVGCKGGSKQHQGVGKKSPRDGPLHPHGGRPWDTL